MASLYDNAFFQFHTAGAQASAAVVVPLVLELVPVKSVVDVGCGVGAWLHSFASTGITDYLGIDGDYVDRSKLLIPPERFVPGDLERTLQAGRRFDLAVCLEVAEHLQPEHGRTLVRSLVNLAPVVLFSAAIPCQGGTGHVNEQWPEYWRDHFAQHDFVAVDLLRDRLWNNEAVELWYRQNLLLYVDRARLAEYPLLEAQVSRSGDRPHLSRVHPQQYLELARANHELRRLNICASLRLRDFNFVVFPDWRLPVDEVQRNLHALFLALVDHPLSPRVALVIHVGSDPTAAQLAEMVYRQVNMPSGTLSPSAPGISGVGDSFGPLQWQVLLECVQGRVILPREDATAIATVQAACLPGVTIESIRRKQPLNLQPLAK